MTSYVGKFASSGIEREIRYEVQSTFTNFTGIFGTRGSGGEDSSEGAVQIDWTHFNYPPLLRIIHFDLKELPTTVVNIVRVVHYTFLLTVVTLVLNIIDSFVISG
eukprot:GHVS01040747.1.p1 GENE.GHVS01040747.1~~GHVS01040747.1.p1  ORF type:complete len:105 (+),score=12.21 GHVS01040747.1:69-383(+)